MKKSIKVLISIIGGTILGVMVYLVVTILIGYSISGQCLTDSVLCNSVIISITALLVKISWIVFIILGVIAVYKLVSKIIK